MIPNWNLQGVIPPTRPGVQGHDPDRSPYLATLHAFVSAMGTSPARLKIIDGLLQFRNEIHKLGVKSGLDSAQDPAALQLLTQAQADLGVMP